MRIQKVRITKCSLGMYVGQIGYIKYTHLSEDDEFSKYNFAIEFENYIAGSPGYGAWVEDVELI